MGSAGSIRCRAPALTFAAIGGSNEFANSSFLFIVLLFKVWTDYYIDFIVFVIYKIRTNRIILLYMKIQY